ncbi:hypothetical protein [Methylomonas koyamae]|nr:hypothetical protein [Methylomonas koyamae]
MPAIAADEIALKSAVSSAPTCVEENLLICDAESLLIASVVNEGI